MGWLFGIPDFSLAQYFTYFNDLQNVSHNTPLGAYKKYALYEAASTQVVNSLDMLTMQRIDQATNFLMQIAESERQKEISIIQAYAKKVNKELPFLDKFNNPEAILANPDEFYSELTSAINEARRGTKEYLTELYRIQSTLFTAGRKLNDYKAEDFRYRAVGDIESFLRRLNGSFGLGGTINEDAYSVKIQQMAMRILDSSGITQKLSNGEDFAAIGAALLLDIEREVQEKMDEEIRQHDKKRDISKITDEALNEIEKIYLNQLSRSENELTPVQNALKDITSIDFLRITENAKKVLGIKMGVSEKELQRRSKQIYNLSASRSKKGKGARTAIRQIRSSLKRNSALTDDLQSMTFSISGSSMSRHGTVYELIESLWNGTKIPGNGAVDILTYDLGFKLEHNDAFFDNIISNISETVSDVIYDQKFDTESNLRDIRESIESMNAGIAKIIKDAEDQIKILDNGEFENLFIYHETLKLHSSMETGNTKTAGFEGRNLNILTYIDFMDSAAVDDFTLPMSRNELAFLALNLIPGAVAEEAREPLEEYFSLFAGLLMFDDIRNMALEAVHKASYSNTHIKQIHLYNLNGIYVPASMLLTYISNEVIGASEYVKNGIAAKATINVPATNAKYEAWKEGRLHGNNERDYVVNELRPEHWEAVGAYSASNTKVLITFLSAFKMFIANLNGL